MSPRTPSAAGISPASREGEDMPGESVAGHAFDAAMLGYLDGWWP